MLAGGAEGGFGVAARPPPTTSDLTKLTRPPFIILYSFFQFPGLWLVLCGEPVTNPFSVLPLACTPLP